ncbi:MAG: hypothetical protein M3Z25_01840 [Actinomycetota bacterium]|nr:hypothetical protein [Actinomycetota bacterium]
MRVVDDRLAVSAAVAAAAQLGVELLEYLDGDVAYRRAAEGWAYVALDHAPVALARRVLDLVDGELFVDRRAQVRPSAVVGLGIDLREQPGADLLGLALSRRRSSEVEALAG